MYYSLLHYHQGKVKNRGNLKRVARRCNIGNPLSLTVAKILVRLKACKKECKFYQEHSQQSRKKHLINRLKIAQEKDDKEAMTKIGAIIQREQQRSFWRKLNFVTGKKRMRSATSVQVEDQSGAIFEHTTKDAVEDCIFSEVHNKRYMMAGEAPICKGELFRDFGYVANTQASTAVLEGTYVAPHESDDAIRELLAQITAIQQIIPKNLVVISITPEQWKAYWKMVNKETSSSESGLHFGRYIVGCKSEVIAHYHAARVSVILAHAIHLERWSWGLSVMLEKTLGNTLVTKLRAILLMEADFNATNKIIYGSRMLSNARDFKQMPEEIFSEKNRMANDGTLCKTLFYDIS